MGFELGDIGRRGRRRKKRRRMRSAMTGRVIEREGVSLPSTEEPPPESLEGIGGRDQIIASALRGGIGSVFGADTQAGSLGVAQSASVFTTAGSPFDGGGDIGKKWKKKFKKLKKFAKASVKGALTGGLSHAKALRDKKKRKSRQRRAAAALAAEAIPAMDSATGLPADYPPTEPTVPAPASQAAPSSFTHQGGSYREPYPYDEADAQFAAWDEDSQGEEGENADAIDDGEDDEFGDIGKKKSWRRKLRKGLKKALPVAAIVASVIPGVGPLVGASLAVAAAAMRQRAMKKAQKAAQARAAAEAAAQERLIREAEEAAAAEAEEEPLDEPIENVDDGLGASGVLPFWRTAN